MIRKTTAEKDYFPFFDYKSIMQLMMAHTEAHLAYLDADFNFLMVNPAYAKGSGYKEEELLGCNHFDLFPNEENQAIFERARDRGEVVEFREKPFEYLDQPERGVTYWDWRLTPVTGITGITEGLVLSLNEVTEVVRARQLDELLHELNGILNAAPNFEEALRAVVQKVIGALGCDSAWMTNRERGGWRLKNGWSIPEDYLGKFWSDNEAPFLNCRCNNLSALIKVPLLIKGNVEGIVCFTFKKPTEFTEGQRRFIENLGDSMSLAMENSRLYHRLKNQNRKLEQIVHSRTLQHRRTNDLLRLSTTQTSQQDYLDSVTSLICQWTDCRQVEIKVLNRGELHCLKTGGASVNVPVMYQNQAIGVLCITHDNAVSDKTIKFLETLTPIVGEALHRFSLEEENARNLETQVVVNGLLQLQSQNFEVDELLDAALDIISGVTWISLEMLVGLIPLEVKLSSVAELIRNKIQVMSGRDKQSKPDRSEVIKFLRIIADALKTTILHCIVGKELRSSEQRFSKSFNANPSPMTIVSLADGHYLDVNEKFAQFVGYKREEIIGRKRSDLQFWSKELDHLKLVETMKESGSLNNLEITYQKKSGEKSIALMSAELIELGGKPCMLTTVNDITQRKRIEEEMARLDRLNLVGEMAAGIGHEIRNPMTTARGFLQLLQAKEECLKYTYYFNLIIEELDRANMIITEFLSMAKNKPIELVQDDLNRIIRAIYALINADATLSNKTVELRLQEIPPLLLDQKEIRQLLINLVRNGLEAMPEGGNLVIETCGCPDGVLLAVRDQGPGIEPAVAAKIGTPFITTKESGTGLGLPICYSIARRHHAVLEFESSSEGTTFFVRFKQ